MKKILSLFLFILIFFITFKDLPQVYYQQDEWHAFGFILGHGTKYIDLNLSPLTLLLNDRTGARILNYFHYNFFGFNAEPLIFLGVVLHLVNSALVFFISNKLTKNRTISYLASLLFLVNSMSSQSYIWLGAMPGAVPSVTFILLSLYFFLDFLSKGNQKYKYLSLFFLWVSFLFKETGLFLFIFYPLMYYLYKKRTVRDVIKENLLLLSYGIITLVLRANEILSPAGQTAVLITTRKNPLEVLGNLVTYPLESFSQAFIPNQIMYGLSSKIVSFLNPALNPDSVDFATAVYITWGTILSVALSIVLFIFFYSLYKDKNFKFKSPLIFSSILLFLSVLPYILLQKGEAYLDPRYFYVGSFASSFLLAIVIFYFLKKKKLFKNLSILFAIFYLLFNIYILRSDIKVQKENAIERKKILSEIFMSVPNISNKTIFYVDGDSPGYYGLPELKVPFQSGLGQILLIKYVYNKKIDPAFLRGSNLVEDEDQGFLYDTVAQGYREINGRGFGYFWDKNTMMKVVKKYKIPREDINSFYYFSGSEILKNTSEELRSEIK